MFILEINQGTKHLEVGAHYCHWLPLQFSKQGDLS